MKLEYARTDPFGRTAWDGQNIFCAKYGANRGGEKDCGGVLNGDVPGAGIRPASRMCAIDRKRSHTRWKHLH